MFVFYRYIDVSLLKEPVFVGMCLSVTLMSVGCPYMLYFLPAYALQAGENGFSIQFYGISIKIMDFIQFFLINLKKRFYKKRSRSISCC